MKVLVPYKFQLVAVCQRIEDGKVVGEEVVSANGQPIVVFGVEGLREFAGSFEDKIAEAEGASADA